MSLRSHLRYFRRLVNRSRHRSGQRLHGSLSHLLPSSAVDAEPSTAQCVPEETSHRRPTSPSEQIRASIQNLLESASLTPEARDSEISRFCPLAEKHCPGRRTTVRLPEERSEWWIARRLHYAITASECYLHSGDALARSCYMS